jgi:hypothetical protein
MAELEKEIEAVRAELVSLYQAVEDFTDDLVVSLSQRLDVLIVEYTVRSRLKNELNVCK